MSHEIRIVRRFAAAVGDVYEAWTDPRLLARWMVPQPGCQTDLQADVRVGGHFRVDMTIRGELYRHHGEYLLLSPPHALEFTWFSEATLQQRSVVRVELRELGSDDTELTLTQRELPSEDSAREHHEGWSGALDHLPDVLA